MKPSRPPSPNETQSPAIQYGALPWRRDPDDGTVMILLVSSRETKRWVIPKGWPMARRSPSEAAAREAVEEAGVEGVIATTPYGAFSYQKRLKRGIEVTCLVEVYPLEVRIERRKWPEKAQRTRQWLTPEAAAGAVQEEALKALILSFARGKAN